MEQKNTKWSAVVFYNLAWLICSVMMIVDLLSIREASLNVMAVIQANQPQARKAKKIKPNWIPVLPSGS
jgi:hypothetical protein